MPLKNIRLINLLLRAEWLNGTLRGAMEEECRKRNVAFYHPSPILCTDNAAMIGAAAYYDYRAGICSGLDLNAVPNLKLGER